MPEGAKLINNKIYIEYFIDKTLFWLEKGLVAKSLLN